MICTYEYYKITNTTDNVSAVVKSERYFNCDNFVKVFSFFKNKK